MSYNVTRYVKQVMARFLKFSGKKPIAGAGAGRAKIYRKKQVGDIYMKPFWPTLIQPFLDAGLTIPDVGEMTRGGNVSPLMRHLPFDKQVQVMDLLKPYQASQDSYQR